MVHGYSIIHGSKYHGRNPPPPRGGEGERATRKEQRPTIKERSNRAIVSDRKARKAREQKPNDSSTPKNGKEENVTVNGVGGPGKGKN